MGYQIGNVDATILAERPKMAPHIMAMRTNIANVYIVILSTFPSSYARRKLGFVGNEEGIVS